jgi:tol-pal system protein YbgF
VDGRTNRRRGWRLLAAAFLLLALAGCWVKKEAGEKMQADIAALQVEFEVVKKAHADEKAQLAARLADADKKAAELKALIDEFQRSTGRNAADIGVDLEKIKTQIMELRGQLEVSSHKVDAIERKLGGLKDDLSARNAEQTASRDLEAKHRLEADKAARDAEKNKNPLSAIKRPERQEDFYKLAYSLLESGQTEASRTLFREFLEKWPSSSYSDNAQYWVAESLYAEGKYRDAALEFQTVREKFPKGDKSPDALLKLGYCFFAMEKYAEALPFLKEFVQTYPKSPLTAKAKEKIKEAEKKGR